MLLSFYLGSYIAKDFLAEIRMLICTTQQEESDKSVPNEEGISI